MLDLFARCLFEATGIQPVANTATAGDWRLNRKPTGKDERVESRKDGKGK